VWTSVDYELDWPSELLAGELRALFDHPYRGWTGGEVELLLTEAFHTGIPAAEFAQLYSTAVWTGRFDPVQEWIADLFDRLPEMRRYAPPRPYWAARQASLTEAPPRDPADVMHNFASLVGLLHAHGYLDRDFAQPCVDDDPNEHLGRDLNLELRARLHGTDPSNRKLWPLQPDTWDTEAFYSLVEVFHDLVARPRHRWDHDHGDCGPHFEDFDTDAGRRVYRGLVNRLLVENTVQLRLADAGEDTGRLVHVVDEARADLIQRTLHTPDQKVAGRVEHAIALFRARHATEHDKRSAIFTLHLVLEERKPLLEQQLFSQDEDALFHIANKFDLRHSNEKQHINYDPAFRDWVFWWYLATVELTDRLLTRQSTQIAAATP
jgi:hypothetical protein